MEMNIVEDARLVEIWLTSAEKDDTKVQNALQRVYSEFANTKYTVAVFESGAKNLYQGTLELLSYNRKRIPEIKMQKKNERIAIT